MAVIDAVIELRQFRTQKPELSLAECCRLLKLTPGAPSTFDYESAIELKDIRGVLTSPPVARETMMRDIVRCLVDELRPPWGMLFPMGRRVVQLNVPSDVRQCLFNAGYFNTSPQNVLWWDPVAEQFRSAGVLGRIEVGRRGELLSMESERSTLASLGHTSLEPDWIAVKDETVGYDIVSFRGPASSPKTVHIEVKASERVPFSFFITDNEWRTAERLRPNYIFHFWYLPAKRLQEVTVDEIACHIPLNRANGTWKKAFVTWPF